MDASDEPHSETGDLREVLGMGARRAPAALTTGQIIDETYRIDGELGAGGMGRVYRAHDLKLERDIAIKLHASSRSKDDDGLRQEGVALAKLAHPNVVTVYGVGTWAGHPWVAMELVSGGTAGAWLREKKRSGREILALYIEAGRGLAAAHAAGLVHRDFKPENVLVGVDGRVRVADFGLARVESRPDEPGAIVGTPAYMAPEQRLGGVVDARADQFGFALSLWEALAGGRPNAVLGTISPPPARSMPRHVELALRRALSRAATDRWPSMPALLAELARDPEGRRRRILLGTASALGVAGLVAFAWYRGAAVDLCQGSQATIATSWGEGQRAGATAHLTSLATAYASESISRVTTTLDHYAGGWAEVHHGSCLAFKRGELSTAQYDRRAACLAVRRAALATVSQMATQTTAERLADLVAAASGLPDVAACENDAALLSPVAPPIPAQAIEVMAVGELIAQVDVKRGAGLFDDAARDADASIARARALAYAPLLARAMLARGRIEQAAWRGDRGASTFSTATTLALSSGDEPLAIEAYARAAWANGTRPEDAAKATDGIALIEALTEHTGARAAFARALLHNNLGSLALGRGDRVAARASFERAHDESKGLMGSEAIELTAALANLQLVLDDAAARSAISSELVALRTRLLGENHPQTLFAKITGAEMIDDSAATRVALRPPCVALHDLHPQARERIAECAHELAWLAAVAQDQADARAMTALAPPDPAAEAAPPITASSAWWEVLDAFESTVASALIHETAGEKSQAQHDLDGAAPLLARIADAMPPAPLHRRQQALETIRARLR